MQPRAPHRGLTRPRSRPWPGPAPSTEPRPGAAPGARPRAEQGAAAGAGRGVCARAGSRDLPRPPVPRRSAVRALLRAPEQAVDRQRLLAAAADGTAVVAAFWRGRRRLRGLAQDLPAAVALATNEVGDRRAATHREPPCPAAINWMQSGHVTIASMMLVLPGPPGRPQRGSLSMLMVSPERVTRTLGVCRVILFA